MNQYFSSKKKSSKDPKFTTPAHSYQLRKRLPCSSFTPAGADALPPSTPDSTPAQPGKDISPSNSGDSVTFDQTLNQPDIDVKFFAPGTLSSSDSETDAELLERLTPLVPPRSVHPSNYYFLTDGTLPLDPLHDISTDSSDDSVFLPLDDNLDTFDTMTDMPSLGLTPPTFSGAPSENADRFQREFESYCIVNNIKADRQLDLFKLLLKGLAQDWLQSLKDDKKKDYATIKTEFNTQYIEPKHPWVNLQKLNARRLQPTESVEDYIKDILALCPDGDSTSKMNHLLTGLDPEDRATLMCQNPTTLDDLVHKMVLLRASHQVRNQSQATVNAIDNATQVAAINNTLARIEERLQCPLLTDDRAFDRRGRSQSPPSFRPRRNSLPSRSPVRYPPPQQSRSFSGRCYRCNRVGHMANNCRSSSAPPQRSMNNFQRSNYSANRGRGSFGFNNNNNRFSSNNRSYNRRLNQ